MRDSCCCGVAVRHVIRVGISLIETELNNVKLSARVTKTRLTR